MLTPVDVQNKVFKGGIGFDKKDVETFMNDLASDYGMLYRSNVELKDKVAALNESLQHYRSIEESMQKALTLSEKTAEETIIAANDKARQINIEAEKKAEAILADAKTELQETKDDIFRLQKQHAKFKEQFTKVLEAQLKIMDGEMIDIDLGPGFEPSQYQDGSFGGFSGGLGSEGGLGNGGGYAGSSSFDDGRERTNQDPMINRGSLNMDPFADAANGGGRFSKQTGGSFNGGSSKNKKGTSNNTAAKSTLNVKNVAPGASKVRKNFTGASNTENNSQNVQTKASPHENSAQTNANTKQNITEEPKSPQSTQPAVKPADRQTAISEQPSRPEQTIKEPQPVKVQMTNTQETISENKSVFINTDQQRDTIQTSHPIHSDEISQVSGEVEDKINEANMLDSEDNYSDGFDFVSESDITDTQASANNFDDAAVTGEVEDKINESNMLDSEDNYSDGFDFVNEDEGVTSNSSVMNESNEDAYFGEVEDKINESNMLDSEDNYNEGFDFVVGNETEDEIPTITPNFVRETPNGYDASLHTGNNTSDSESLNIDPFHNDSEKNDDILVGDVEDVPKQSNLIGNADDEEDGFNFL